jgi:hypothetical protein
MAVMRGNLQLSIGRRFFGGIRSERIENLLKMPKLPKYEGKCAFRSHPNDLCALESTSPLNFLSLRVKALLILGN